MPEEKTGYSRNPDFESVQTEELFSKSRSGQAIVFLDDSGTAYAAGEDGLLASGDDHTSVVQAALDQKGEVIFKQGEYRINCTLPRHTVIRGSGRQQGSTSDVAALLPDDPSLPIFERSASDPANSMVELNTIIKDLVIDGDGGTCDLFSMTAVYNLFAKDCMVQNTSGRAFDFNKVWDSWIVRCKISACGDASNSLPQIHLRNTTASPNDTNGIRIIECAGGATWQYLTATDGSARVWLHNSRIETGDEQPYAVEFQSGSYRNWITNNVLIGGTSAALKAGNSNFVALNEIGNPHGGGIELVNQNHRVAENWIHISDIGIAGTVPNSNIQNNRIEGGTRGIDIDVASDNETWSISGNVITDMSVHGVSISGAGSCRVGVVSGNTIDNINTGGGSAQAIRVFGVDGISIASNGVGSINGGAGGILVDSDADTFVVANRVEEGGINTVGSSTATVTANDA